MGRSRIAVARYSCGRFNHLVGWWSRGLIIEFKCGLLEPADQDGFGTMIARTALRSASPNQHVGQVLADETSQLVLGRVQARPPTLFVLQNVGLTADNGKDWVCNLAVTVAKPTLETTVRFLCRPSAMRAWPTRRETEFERITSNANSFRDDKSGSFNLEATTADPPRALETIS